MLGTYFSHSIIRKSVILFGNVFNNISIRRVNTSDDTVQQIKVPIAFSPAEKFIAALDDKKSGIAFQLPRMAFDIRNLSYEASRQTQHSKKEYFIKDDSYNTFKNIFTPVNYMITFELSCYARNASDLYQIVEQILPFFAPCLNITAKIIPSLNIVKDIPLIMEGNVVIDHNYEFSEGDTKSRAVTANFSFNMKMPFYGPIGENAVITEAITQIHTDMDTEITPDDISSNTLSNTYQRITVTPDPLTAEATDDYGFSYEYEINE